MTSPESPESQSALKYAELLLKKGMQDEARALLETLARQDPSCARARYLLAVLRASQGEPREAAELFKEALSLSAGDVRALNGLGVALQQLKRPEEAASCYLEALRIDPRYLGARINLALLFKEHGMLSDAERELDKGLSLDPGSVPLAYNLANVIHLQGRSLDAVDAYRRTLRLDPDHLDARQNLLFALHYSSSFSQKEIYAEHLDAARTLHFRPPAVTLPAAAPRSNGRIRVGYLSPDFRDHAVASFLEPILAHHDRERFEIFCYANLSRPDGTTERMKGLADHWRDIWGMGDEQAAGTIARDGIDILVDLAGHTSGNRLPLFARRPAPLQVTWIGYPDTTGLSQMDYRITDRLADPPGTTERHHSEELVRLPRSFCCYQPHPDAPEVAPPPSLADGRITFGSFNNLCKVTPEVIALWSRVLHGVPGSRFLIKAPPLSDPQVRERLAATFAGFGIEPGRVELQGGNRSIAEHLGEYRRVDIALDTSPYNGTTTTCEALWMGVPVVTLAGERHSSRTGVSILTNCGLEELVAADAEAYLETALRLAGDAGWLRRFREGTREGLKGAPLLDAAGITRELEEALLGMMQRGRRGCLGCR